MISSRNPFTSIIQFAAMLINMKSLPNSVELLVYFVRSDFQLQGHVGEMIRPPYKACMYLG